MINTTFRVPASGPRNARLAVIGMAPAKNEVTDKRPFTGPSGRILDDALAGAKTSRAATYVTNLVDFYIDDNDLYAIPQEIIEQQRNRVFQELDTVRPNCLLILGADTLDLLTATSIHTYIEKKTDAKKLKTHGSKEGIIKWRGSIFQMPLPNGRLQKCVAAMHPANFVRGQWKWLPLFRYIDVPRAVTQSSFSDLRLTTRSMLVAPSFPQAMEWLEHMNQQEWVGIDYEGMEYITCLGSGSTSTEALCIPLNRVGSPSYWNLEQELQIWKLWCRLLENPRVKKIAQNKSYEIIRSWQMGIYPRNFAFDTMHGHHCLYPDWGGVTDEWLKRKRALDNPGHGLALIISQYTDIPYYKDDGRHWTPKDGEIKFWQYNCQDVYGMNDAAFKMMAELKAAGLWETYQEQYVEMAPHTLRMEWFGNKIDVEQRANAKQECLTEMEGIREKLEAAIKLKVITKVAKRGQKPEPGVLNLASPAQMKAYFTAQKYVIPVNPKTGQPKLDKDDLAALAIKYNDDSIPMMLRMRAIQDLINDVLDQPLDAENRIHCHYKIGGTNGTRWSSTESILGGGTNLQNLPRNGPARSCFIPTKIETVSNSY